MRESPAQQPTDLHEETTNGKLHQAQVGVHELHYAMVVVLSMGVGLFAPPFGVGYYAACAVGRVDPAEGMKPIVGYVLALLVGLAIVAAVPWISTGFLKG